MKARLGAGRANLQRADNQINRHDVAGIPDDRAQVKHLVKLEPAGDGVRLAQRKAYGAGDDEVPVLGTYEKTPERWYSNVFRGFSLRASGGS